MRESSFLLAEDDAGHCPHNGAKQEYSASVSVVSDKPSVDQLRVDLVKGGAEEREHQHLDQADSTN